MGAKKINRDSLERTLTTFFEESTLTDNEAEVIIDYHKFDDQTLIELALDVIGLVYEISGREIADVLENHNSNITENEKK